MKKVLIIEDDEQISRVYEIKLKQEKIETATAIDGDDGLKKILSEKPDLILLDLMIPKHDGFWILEEMKKNQSLAKIPVIVLSNLGQKGDIDRALNLGAKDYFIKADISVQNIIDKIKEYLN